MTIVVLAKVVPDLERLFFDPDLGVMQRERAPLFVNPLDQRALAASLSLREAGEVVEVLSMSPPSGTPALAELYAHGADRVRVISDPALAGSDSLVTARVLAAALRGRKADLIVLGKASTDSSTAQLPAQLAELLDRPLLSEVRVVHQRAERTINATCELEDGWVRRETKLPAVVSVSERIGRPRKPDPGALAAARDRPLESLPLPSLGLSPSDVGLLASPTRVLRLIDDRPSRVPVALGDGAPPDRVEKALTLVGSLLRPSRRRSPSPLPPPPAARDSGHEVIVLCSQEHGGLSRAALPLLSQVCRTGGDVWPTALGYGTLPREDERSLVEAGAQRILWGRTNVRPLSGESLLPWLDPLLERTPRPAALLFPATAWGREVAGRAAARHGLGLVGDATGWRLAPSGDLVFEKPSFGGGTLAEVGTTRAPALATVRRGAVALGPSGSGESPSVLVEDLPELSRTERVRLLEEQGEGDPRLGDLETARVVVCVGMGLGGPEHLPDLLSAISPLGAAVGATRRVVDAGWLPPRYQVGLTGKFLAPDLCIEVGVSGKDNHVVALQRARVIVGINPNPREPLFSRVDVGLVGAWEELLAPLARGLAPLLSAPSPGTL